MNTTSSVRLVIVGFKMAAASLMFEMFGIFCDVRAEEMLTGRQEH